MPESGTLGSCFIAETKNGRVFLKTHPPGRLFLENMRNQIAILRALYGNIIQINDFTLTVENTSYLFLMMDVLRELDAAIDAKILRDVTMSYLKKTKNVKMSGLQTFDDFLHCSQTALKTLTEIYGLKKSLCAQCKYAIDLLKTYSADSSCLCHGDLSNKNIMLTDSGKYIVIDWEDMFYGIPEYDVCYWLTFFDQRSLYSTTLMSQLEIRRDIGISLMTLIVVIKCSISAINNTCQNNKVSFDNRIQEILDMY